MAVAALVLGICSIALPWVLCFLPVIVHVIAIACGIVAIILSIMEKKKTPEKSGVLTAALVLGIIGTALAGITLVICGLPAMALASAASSFGNDADVQNLLNSLNNMSN